VRSLVGAAVVIVVLTELDQIAVPGPQSAEGVAERQPDREHRREQSHTFP